MALINYLTRIHFADGVLEEALRAEVDGLGIKRPLLVTDKGLVEAGLAERAEAALPSDVIPTLFDDTPSNPTEEAAALAAATYRNEDCDGLIGFGGGSSLDLARQSASSLPTMDHSSTMLRSREGSPASRTFSLP